MKIHLKCCCGAEIEASGTYQTDLERIVAPWQERHKDCKPIAPVINANPIHQWEKCRHAWEIQMPTCAAASDGSQGRNKER